MASPAGCWTGLLSSFNQLNHRVDSQSSANPSSASAQNSKHVVPNHVSTCASCTFSNFQPQSEHDLPPPPYPLQKDGSKPLAEKFLRTIESCLDELDPELRTLSLDIHSHPEMKWEEHYAHDTLSTFMETHGFKVIRHYFYDTAWKAEFSYSCPSTRLTQTRVIGVNSEMDALPSGHACGHNLIAAGGVGIAIALKAAMEAHRIPGKVILLGTPAEEGGGGKVGLLEHGAYDEMDACVMIHPAPGPPKSAALGKSTAVQPLEAEYIGKSAHVAFPWEGTNALDAAFIAYSAISALRQQIKPTHRIHGVISGKDWVSNVIPDYAKVLYGVRASSLDELDDLTAKVENCLKAGSLASSCQINLHRGVPYYDLKQNPSLGSEFSSLLQSRYGFNTISADTPASTDFGNVSHGMCIWCNSLRVLDEWLNMPIQVLPALHPAFAIPTVPNGGNHTPEFVKAAASIEAHNAMVTIIKGLSATCLKFLVDDDFARRVCA